MPGPGLPQSQDEARHFLFPRDKLGGGGSEGERMAVVEGGGSRILVAGSRKNCNVAMMIFRNRKSAKRREPTKLGREPALKGTESGNFKPSLALSPPIPPLLMYENGLINLCLL